MDILLHGLKLTAIPFAAVFLLITIWWGLVDLSVRRVKGRKRALWTLLVILLPPIGALLYSSMHKEQGPTPAS